MDHDKDASYHDSVAAEYDRVVVEPREAALRRLFAPALKRLARHAPFARLFDIGCGTGQMLLRAGPLAREAVAVDHSAGMLAVARANAARAGLSHARFEQADLRAFLDAHRGEADLVTAVGVLHHHDPRALPDLLASLHASLRPGGWLLLSEPVADGAVVEPEPIRRWNRASLAAARDYSAPGPEPDEAPLPPSALRRAIADAGFAMQGEWRAWEIYNHTPEPGLLERLRIGWLQRRHGASGFVYACLARRPVE